MVIKDIHGKILMEIEGDRPDLDELELPFADFSGLTLEGLWIVDSDLTGANFNGANLYWCMAPYAKLIGADLRHTILRGAALDYADLTDADLCNADLSLDNLGGYTNLSGAILTGIKFNENTKFTGARYSDETVFPDGFNPEEYGMLKIEEDED